MKPSELNQSNLDNPRFVLSGTEIRDGNGLNPNHSVVHSCGFDGYQVFITPLNTASLIPFTILNKTGDLFTIQFDTPPPAGTDNLQFDWLLVKVMTANIE